MDIQQPKIDLKDKFELYLEGVQVDFSSISISETEGGIPAASISFPSSYGATRILPGTIVQVFGYVHREKETYLLFEGEVTAVNYQKGENIKVVVLKAMSLLGSMIRARFRPSDAIMTQEQKDATGIQSSEAIIVSDHTQNSSVGYKTLGEMTTIKNEKSDVVNGKLKDIGISSVFGLTDEFQKALAEDQPGGKGDFIPLLQQFNIYFEYNDLFYGLKSLAYKFGRTIFASPNPDLLNKIKVDLFLEALNKVKSSGISDIYGAAPYTLMQVLSEFQRYLHYSFICPATYTACKPFYVDGATTAMEPLRMTYLPTIDMGPPLLSNIIFPEQVNTFTYSREMMEEPTRIVGKATMPFIDKSKTNNIDLSPCIAYPEIKFEAGKATGNFTTEETFRGINYKVISYSNLQSDLIMKDKTKTESGKKTTAGEKPVEDEVVSGKIGEVLKPFTYADFSDLKYKTRQTAITTEWNPYRVIGLPALMIDSDGVSVLGILSSIQTDITATGRAVSRLILRNTRLMHDKEFGKTIFSTLPASNITSNEKYLIHDLTNDGVMATNELLYYQPLYSFENIGKDVYTYIAYGALSNNKGYYDVAKNKQMFDGYLKNLEDNSGFEKAARIDNSILHFLRNEDGSYNIEIPDEYIVKSEIKNTYLLYKAVQKLRQEYEVKKYKMRHGKKEYDLEQLYEYIHLLTKRPILKKNDYFNFIGATPDRKSQLEDAHDAQSIFGQGINQLRDTIVTDANNQYKAVITTTTAKRLNLRNQTDKLQEQADLINPKKIKKAEDFTKWMNSKAPEKQQSTNPNTLWTLYGNDWKTYTNLTTQIAENKQKIKELESTIPNPTDIDYSQDVYKPYNMTRRMHVLYAFKDTSNILIDDENFKLTVTK